MRKFILSLFLVVALMLIPNAVMGSVGVDQSEQYDCWALGDYDQSWGVVKIGADNVHLTGNTGAGVKLAIVDTGVDYTHPELASIYKGGYDFVNNDSDPMDDHYHGTHCAGIAAAAIGDLSTVGGVAPSIDLYAVKVLSSSGSGTWTAVINGVDWCIANDIDVMSFSLGGSGSTIELEAAFQRAWDAGLVTIAAAGNSSGGSSSDTILYPARYASVVAVAATDINNARASFSSTGPATEVSAPGVNIVSAALGGGFRTASGTSMACPHVSGLTALVKVAHPDWTNTEVRGQLRASCDDLYTAGHDWLTGWGIVNAVRAVGDKLTDPGMPPLPPAPIYPTPYTLPATEIGSTSVRLNGEIKDMGNLTSVNVRFSLGYANSSDSYGIGSGVMESPGTYSFLVTQQNFSLLQPNTAYRFSFVVYGASVSKFGTFLTFTTLPAEPPPPTKYVTATFNATSPAPRTINLTAFTFEEGTTTPVTGSMVTFRVVFGSQVKTYIGFANSSGNVSITVNRTKWGTGSVTVVGITATGYATKLPTNTVTLSVAKS